MVKDEDGRARETIDYQGLKVIPGGMGFHRGASEEFLVPNELLDALVKKEWYATGYRVPVEPGSKREYIPATWWEFLTFTTPTTTSGGGLKFVSVRFYEAEVAAPRPTIVGETDCCNWLVELMKDRRTKTVGQLRSEADQFDVSHVGFKRALKHAKEQSTTPETWQKPGPAGSS